jgi:hypothetical protein
LEEPEGFWGEEEPERIGVGSEGAGFRERDREMGSKGYREREREERGLGESEVREERAENEGRREFLVSDRCGGKHGGNYNL